MKKTFIAIALAATIAAPNVVAFAPPSASVSTISHPTILGSKTGLFMSENGGPTKSAMVGGAGVNNAGEPPFEIRGFSLGNVVILAGVLITVLSFAEYLSDSVGEGLSISGLGFVYGIPIFLGGAALKYAEIEPVPSFSTPAGASLFDSKATETIQKIKQDVTRHRYGDEAHLDTTVKKLGLVVPGKAYPQLRELREEEIDGELAFMMVWQSLDTPYKMWADERRVKKYETFFGPGVSAEVVKVDAEERLVGIRLITKSNESKTETEEAASVSA
mmetsp:Transcript_91365/g.136801  ORF Transcript_91365/g.136801 Transcript_91365/m.136801 type:complete len:274 (+) Transcript_91365:32-853(+)|eukprot:CAMPEP_0116996366 /NCGR_PEP_ID=MMETSP0472-20121206/194_1 /TAXON_ID=693140 ORGANISM="Tiarina fusus, Strain LIS" /NCGR_SAMPLE_ID=MMETSP0472 /ASSEMBLY_ACC=CAM_ASM_000603 /LENGTH=273 /DNA_ID=CAMNT_0004694959 /DNA_START=15 /DNA_END=836 /DNA_ORIENTATION=-